MLEIFIPHPGSAVLSPYLKGMKTENTWKMAFKYLSSLSFGWYNYEVYTFFFPIKSALVPLATQMYYLRVQKSQINLTELNLRCRSGCIPPGSSREFLPCPSQVLEVTCISWLVAVSCLLLLPSSH